MTVPEESRPRTRTTDEARGRAPRKQDAERPRRGDETDIGRELREAMENAGVNREDFER